MNKGSGVGVGSIVGEGLGVLEDVGVISIVALIVVPGLPGRVSPAEGIDVEIGAVSGEIDCVRLESGSLTELEPEQAASTHTGRLKSIFDNFI